MSDELETPAPEPDDPNFRAALRNAEAEAKAAKAQLEALQRERAFDKAGIPEDGAGALLRKAYDGPVDPDEIRKAADQYGILQPSTPPPPTESFDAELQAMQRAQGATAGGGVGGGPTDSEKFLTGLGAAQSVEDVLAVVREYGDGRFGFVASN